MLRIDEATGRLVTPEEGTLKGEGLLERSDVQEMFARSWDGFTAELGFRSLRFVGTEVPPHDSVGNRIDILAFDEDLGRPVVIELKRGSDKLHLLQALSYAAMVWTWDSDRLRKMLPTDADENLINSIDNMDSEVSPAVILVAEAFEPEVIYTADWLHRKHDIDVYCFTLSVHRFSEERWVMLQLDYPQRELEELYRVRAASRRKTEGATQSWEDIKNWITYAWGRELIDLCKRFKDGDPRRRRFSAMFPSGDWGSCHLTFQKQAVSVHTYGRREGDKAHWESALPGISIDEWGSEASQTQGLTWRLTTEEEARTFLKAVGQPWLPLEPP
jgi:hypothetical protein